MISGEKIATYIAHPDRIDAADLGDLKTLCETYPYCSSFYSLYLKGLALVNDIRFEEELKTVAAHTPDRTHLYMLIHSQEKVQQEQERVDVEQIEVKKNVELEREQEQEQEQGLQEDVSVEQVEVKETQQENTEEETEEKKVVATESIDFHVEDEQFSELVEGSESITADQREETDAINIADALDVDIYTNAIDIAYAKSGISEEEERQQELEQEQERISVEQVEVGGVQEEERQQELEQEQERVSVEQVEVEGQEKDEVANPPSDLSFVEWLKQKRKGSRPTEAETTKREEEKTTEEHTEPKESTPQKPTRKTVDALLEKFIAEEPSISRPVKDFYNPAKNARKSVEESDDLVSETLAKIYVIQKNYSKAISAYEQLSLLYPKKKVFFADQIKKIKAEINKK